ncbi:flavin reductase family protein [Streptomyces sp. AN091965]|uniref:flavin reductase family protein n=1 Tax=Streptomyces sp. AN091965 TaxID=2927803 RepID=UPI001F611CD1|nr:flavin reductase family protein [Streptomyces sp. AN091965]MCI3935209.1 flavin reductase family protein [Streptomyces sp. AN091965]
MTHGLPGPGRLALAPLDRLLVGDHALVIGRVTRAWHAADGCPPVHHDGGRVRLSDALALTAGEE